MSMLVIPFPKPGPMLRQAFKELDIAAYGTDEQKQALGDVRDLPRPWDPSSVTNPKVREQLWAWLDRVVVWLNHEYGWRAEDLVPECWPVHPPIVREIAVLADLRRRAGVAATSDSLEEWHRYALPAFTDRMNRRMNNASCSEKHQDWPGRGPHTRHVSEPARTRRGEMFAGDLEEINARHAKAQQRQDHRPPGPHPATSGDGEGGAGLRLVDTPQGSVDASTGEVLT